MEETRTLRVLKHYVPAFAAVLAVFLLALAPSAARADIYEGNQKGSLRESLQLEGCYAEAMAYGRTDDGDIHYLACNGPSAIFTTTDGGETWSGPPSDADYGSPIDVAAGGDPNVAYMIAGINLWRTTDAGASWTNIGGDNANFNQNIYASGSVLMATFRTNFQLAYSFDEGDNISYVNITNTEGHAVHDMAAGRDGTLYALVGTEDSTTLYSSSNGSTWTDTGKSGDYTVIQTHPTDEDYIVIAGSTVEYTSTGAEGTWNDMSHPAAENIERISVSPSGTVVAGTRLTNDNGSNWSLLADATLDIRPDFFVTDSSGKFFMKTSNGVAVSADFGTSWEQKIDGIHVATIYNMSITNNKKNMWLAVYGGFVKAENFKRTTKGKLPTWSALLTPGESSFEATYTVWVHPTEPDTVLAAGDSVYRSTDGGDTWSSVSVGGGNVNAFAFDAGNDKVYAGTSTGAVLVSSDDGATWTDTGLSAGVISDLAVDAQGRVVAGVGTENTTQSSQLGAYVYDGSSWSQVSGLTGWASDVMYVPAEKRMYIGLTDSEGMGSVYYSEDNSNGWESWTQMSELPEDMYGPTLAVEDNGNVVYAAYTRPAGTGYIMKCNKNGSACGVFYTGLVDEQFNAILFDDFVSVGTGMYRYESKARLTLKRKGSKDGKVRLRATLKDRATNKKLKNKRVKLYRRNKSGKFRAIQKKTRTKTNKKGRANFFVNKAGRYRVRWVPKKSVAKAAYTNRTTSKKVRVKKKAVNNAAMSVN